MYCIMGNHNAPSGPERIGDFTIVFGGPGLRAP